MGYLLIELWEVVWWMLNCLGFGLMESLYEL